MRLAAWTAVAVVVAALAIVGIVLVYQSTHRTPPQQTAVCTGYDNSNHTGICHFVTQDRDWER